MTQEDRIRLLTDQAAQAVRSAPLPAALSALQRLEEIDPISKRARGLRLEYLLRAGSLGEACSLANQLVEKYPDSARIQWLAGRCAFRDRRYVEALGCFEESQKIHPSAETQEWIGRTLTSLKRFDAAEAVLLAAKASRPGVLRHLAWLYELRGQLERAVDAIDALKKRFPGDRSCDAKRLQLRARMAAPEELLDEVDSLTALGEDVAGGVVPEWFGALFAVGRSDEARRFLSEKRSSLDARTKLDLSWRAYRGQAYDIAYELFLEQLASRPNDDPLRNSLEVAAFKIGRGAELLAHYRELAAQDPRFHGRANRIRRRLAGG